MSGRLIYHLARQADFERAAASAHYAGAREDTADGFMHFSTAEQVVESAARHQWTIQCAGCRAHRFAWA